MARKKSYLVNQCNELGVVYSSGDTIADLMNRLRDVICKDRDILPQVEVMLCKNAKDFIDYSLEKPWDTPKMHSMFWNNDSYIGEPKLDGIRQKLHLTLTGGRTDTRNPSDVDYAYTENSGNFPHIQRINVPGLYDTILDGEMISPVDFMDFGGVKSEGTLNCTTRMTNSDPDWAKSIQAIYGQVHFVAFDIIKVAGEDMRHLPLWRRRKMLEAVINQIHMSEPETQEWLSVTDLYLEDKMSAFEQCLERGIEGVVLKDKYGLYHSGKRPNCQWKLKKFIELSGFITGALPGEGNFEGLVGAVLVSAYNEAGDIVEFGAFSAFPMELRKRMTAEDGSLNPLYLDQVVDIRAQESTKNNRMRHCVLVRFRPDLLKGDCHIKTVKDTIEQD